MSGEGMWKVRSRSHDFEWSGELLAYWEAHLDPISDDFTPAEISAVDLLRRWTERVEKKFSDGLVPIDWYVPSPSQGKLERMPFQLCHLPGPPPEDFLTLFTWPENAATGQRLNWLTLPVVDKLWNKKHADKGGFIQEATGWKPSILQPFVYLPAILEAAGIGGR